MLKQICEISASSWFCYKEICYDARSHERKILQYGPLLCLSNSVALEHSATPSDNGIQQRLSPCIDTSYKKTSSGCINETLRRVRITIIAAQKQ